MKLAIIRTLRRIADAMEGRAEFPPVKRAGIEPDTPWPSPKWCAWEGAICGQPADCLLYGCGAERAANAQVAEAKAIASRVLYENWRRPAMTSKIAGVTIKHPPSMADEVEKMRAEQERDIANVEVPAVIRKFQPTNPRAKPARLTPIRKPRG